MCGAADDESDPRLRAVALAEFVGHPNWFVAHSAFAALKVPTRFGGFESATTFVI